MQIEFHNRNKDIMAYLLIMRLTLCQYRWVFGMFGINKIKQTINSFRLTSHIA